MTVGSELRAKPGSRDADWKHVIADSIGRAAASGQLEVLVHFSGGRVGGDEWVPASEGARRLQARLVLQFVSLLVKERV